MASKNGDKCVIGYEQRQNKYVTTVKKCSGAKLSDDIAKLNKQFFDIQKLYISKEEKEQKWAEIQREYQAGVKQFFAQILTDNPYAFDVSLLGISVDRHGIHTGGKILSYDGQEWTERDSQADLEMSLGEKYRLKKSNNAYDTYKIYYGGKLMFNSNSTAGSSVQLSWPQYFSSQAEEHHLQLYIFSTNETVEFPNEQFSRLSNNLVLVTVAKESDTAILRPIHNVVEPELRVLAKQTLELGVDDNRVTSYEYLAQDLLALDNGFVFKRNRMLHGNNATKFGWYEQRYDPLTMTSTLKVFNGAGQLVKDVEQKEEPKRDNPDANTVIVDKSGRLPIVDVYPRNVTQAEVVYYGFEEYESALIGGSQVWHFDDNHLVTENGNRFLRLHTTGSKLEGTFNVGSSNDSYIFSCWLRTSYKVKVGDPIEMVTAILGNDGKEQIRKVASALVQQRIQDWCYVELLMADADLKNATIAKVNIASTELGTVDIDHVRFSPLNVDFKAHIYSKTSANVGTVLHNNGLVTQYIYDAAGHKVVRVTEQGEISHFITHTKTYLSKRYEIPPQVMEIKPRIGTYEVMDESFFEHWKADDTDKWKIQNGQLIHNSSHEHILTKHLSMNSDVIMIRFLYQLEASAAKLHIIVDSNRLAVLLRSPEQECINRKECTDGDVPDYGEIVAFISKVHRAVWFEGQLIYEVAINTSDMSKISLAVSETVRFSEVILFHDPSITITYYNLLGLPLQTIVMQDSNFVRMKEVMYDELDRPTITTKWTTVQKSKNWMFNYNREFITSAESTQLTGLVNQYNLDCDGFPYFRKEYGNNPSCEILNISLPGKKLSQDKKYSRVFTTQSDIKFLDVLFPPKDGFTQEVEIWQNITTRVTLRDIEDRKVGYYVRIGDVDQRLSTYQYHDDNLILELPPIYHQLADTFERQEPLWNGNLSAQNKELQAIWGTHYEYDTLGRLISKRTPDSGTEKYLYSSDNILRFLVHKSNLETDKIVYFSYGSTGNVLKEAIVNLAEEDLAHFMGNDTISPISTNFVEYYRGEFDPSPNIRHRSQQSVKCVEDKQMTEILLFNDQDQITKKIHVVPALNTTYSIDYEYLNGVLKTIRYPIDVNGTGFEVTYNYNNAGDMIGIGTPTVPEQFAKLKYNSDGLLKDIMLTPGSSFTYERRLNYNEPGYLVSIEDDFLTQTISYLEDEGYGSTFTMILAGLISKTSFTSHWHRKSNPSLSKLRIKSFVAAGFNQTYAESCLDSLQTNGYIDDHRIPRKSFYTELDDNIGEACRSNKFCKVLLKEGFPETYGHSYDYDNHQQLFKAKYFQSSREASWKPLVETSFSSCIPSLGVESSKRIWRILTDHEFIAQSCLNPGMCEGFPGKSLLTALVPDEVPIKTLILNAIAEKRAISAVNFEEKCAQWSSGSINCGELWKQLLTHNIVGVHSKKTLNALDQSLREILSAFSTYLPDIVGVLHQHFSTRLGNSPGDVLSCLVDPNGNHRMFNVGFDKYQLNYKQGTNQIETVTKLELNNEKHKQLFRMEHNGQGSVTVAMHKGIQQIDYDSLSNRPSSIKMVDGRKLLFQYDVRGERTFKQVLCKAGNVQKEKYYIRDLSGRVLVDIEMAFLTDNQPPDIQITSYVYSNTGLIGFVRNDEFYSVFTDHAGSVRLVIKDGEVKAAYDYHPYGHILRKSEGDLDGRIHYLYIGQEWDEETGLYNYHTRLYDPEIGRFYQVDPKGQYASPYVYAGNSPIAIVDPDGQFAFLLVSILLGILGAYLGGAAANNSWNPAKWDWKSSSTWLGILGGGLAGVSLPYSMTSTMTYLMGLGLSTTTSVSIMIGTGLGFSYLSMAAANNDWDSRNWDMQSPATWNALFSGIATSSWIITNPSDLVGSYAAISTTMGKSLFIGSKIALSGGLAYMFGVLAHDGEYDPSKWDFSKPGLYLAVLDGVTLATTIVNFSSNLPKKIVKWEKKINAILDKFEESMTFIRINTRVGADWSKRFANVRYFLKANAEGLDVLKKGALATSFYSIVTSLRLSQTIEHSAVPEFEVMLDYITGISMTQSFSDQIAAKVIPPISPVQLHSRTLPDYSESVPLISSGASRLFNSVFEFVNDWMPYFFRTVCNDRTIETFMPQDTVTKKSFTIPNCYRLSRSDKEKLTVECYGHRSKVSIFLEQDTVSITEDVFHSCYPMSYKNIPSVSCEGQDSSLLYAAYEEPRIFQFVDGWVLLIRVMPTAIRHIVEGVRYVFGGKQQLIETKGVGDEDANKIQNELHDLRCFIDAADANIGWVEQVYNHLQEDVLEFVNDTERDHATVTLLKERISAVREDILEEQANVPGAQTIFNMNQTDTKMLYFKAVGNNNYLQETTQQIFHGLKLLS